MGAHDPVLRDHGYHQLRIKQVVRETADASSFALDIPDELRETFRYQPGQFCTFRVSVGGEEQFRSYSMSSDPGTDADLTVTVKRVAGGLVSNWFLDNLSDGDVMEVSRPGGVFCPQPTERPVLAFCGGSGITPVMSIAKHVLATTQRSVRLLYANRDRDSVIFDAGLAALGAAHPGRLEVQHHFDADTGFLTKDAVASFAAAGGGIDADCYICGPGPFMDLVESTLQGLGVEPDRIFIERFLVEEQMEAAAPTGAAAAAATPAADAESDGDEGPIEVTIHLGGKKVVVDYHAGDSILETARRGGLRPPFSCQAGNCATCMAFLTEGSVTMRANNALDPGEVEEGWILTCQSVPTAAKLVVEYEAM